MGKPKIVCSLIELHPTNQYQIFPIEGLADVEVNIEKVKSLVEFEVIEIVNDTDSYLALLGID